MHVLPVADNLIGERSELPLLLTPRTFESGPLLSRPRMHMGAITRAQMIKMTHQWSAIHEKPAVREFVMGESHLGI